MNTATKIFLVVLRLAIGWQFLFEGAAKLNTVYNPTDETRPYSSVGFLRQATGPFRTPILEQVGDPDQQALAQLDPDAITAAWHDYYQRFHDQYGLTPDQSKKAEDVLLQRQTELLQKPHLFKDAYPGRQVPTEQTLAARVAEYRQKLADLQSSQQNQVDVFRLNVNQAKFDTDQADIARRRGELLTFLDDQTTDLKKALADILTPEQKAKGPVPTTVSSPHWLSWDNDAWLRWMSAWAVGVIGLVMFLSNLGGIMRHWGHRGELGGFGRAVAWLWTLIGAALLGTAAVYLYMHWRDYSRVEIMDWLSSWGLLMIGACLLLGFMTRSAAFSAALFLLTLYLWWPPLPWLPANPHAEGFVPFVNKNAIELIALLVLACTRTGRWFGVDGVIQFFHPWRYRRPRRVAVPIETPRAQRVARV